MSEARVELTPHPIRDKVAHLLKDGTGGEPAEFPPESAAELSQLLEAYVAQDDHELHEVVRTLISIYEWLKDDEGCPTAADALKATFKTDKVNNRIMAIEKEMQANEAEGATSKGSKFESFADRASDKKAPKVGEEAPEGSLKLGNLNFPKKL